MDAKHKTEADMQGLKEQIRKLEQEIEKLTKENKELSNKEVRANEAMAQQMNRAQALQKELQEAKDRIRELEDKLAALEKEYKDRLRAWQRNRGSTKSTDFGGSVDSSTTGGGASFAHSTYLISNLGGTIVRDASGGGDPGEDGGIISGGDTVNIDTTYIGGGGGKDPSGAFLDPELVDSKIKSIEDKWRAEVDKLENERVSIHFYKFIILLFSGSTCKSNSSA